ncbi:MAG: zinc ribbon domain-containing protein [Methanoregulaceae archaeon]|jgi:hypothetical protein
MDDPELRSNESVILKTQNVFVKSLPFEAILTNKRIILVDRNNNLIPPKDVLLATIRDFESGENAIRDPIITLSIITNTGDTRQMVLTFSRQAGGNRKRDRDEWLKLLRGNTSSSLVKAIRKVVPSLDFEPKKKLTSPPPSQIDLKSKPVPKKEIEGAQPIKKIVDTSSVQPNSMETTSLLHGSFCSRCGNHIAPESLFCNKCGTKIMIPGQNVNRDSTSQPTGQSIQRITVPQSVHEKRSLNEEIRSIEPLIEGSVPRSQPAPVIKSQTIPTPSTTPPDSIDQELISKSTKKKQPPHKTRSIFPQIFPRKKIQKKAPSETPLSPAPKKTTPFSSRRKKYIAVAVIAIVIIAIIFGVFLYGKFPKGTFGNLSSFGNAQPETTTPHQIAGPLVIVPQSTTIIPPPPTGVWVRVDYIGSWKGSYGKVGALQSVVDSGLRQYQIESPNGTIKASIQKQDGSNHELVVEIYKNGVVVKQGTTSAPQGSVDISIDLTNAIPSITTTIVQKTVNSTTTATTKPTTVPLTTTSHS